MSVFNLRLSSYNRMKIATNKYRDTKNNNHQLWCKMKDELRHNLIELCVMHPKTLLGVIEETEDIHLLNEIVLLRNIPEHFAIKNIIMADYENVIREYPFITKYAIREPLFSQSDMKKIHRIPSQKELNVIYAKSILYRDDTYKRR